jgi:hypothetical protein
VTNSREIDLSVSFLSGKKLDFVGSSVVWIGDTKEKRNERERGRKEKKKKQEWPLLQ